MYNNLNQLVELFLNAYSELTPPVERKDLLLEVEKYLSHLIASDGSISESEADFLNGVLGMGLKTRDLANFITSYDTYGNRFGNTLPPIFEAHLDNFEASTAYVNLMETLGKACIVADDRADANEVQNLTKYITMLDDALQKRYPDRKRKALFDESSMDVETDDEEKTLEELLEELDELIGLETVKQNVRSLVHLQDIQMERERRGMKRIPISNHLVFLGNPGTGKTTIARLIARIYYRLGVIKENNFVEVDRSGLVAGYVGQTAIEVKNVMDAAKDGVLFVDEAYALSNGVRGDYGHEAIQTILKRMEDEREHMIVIVAGYPKLMEEFLESNPGLESRFSKKIFFPDYTPDELIDILKYMSGKNGVTVSDGGLEYTFSLLKERYDNRDENFANAREVRNMFEAAVVRQADRLYGVTDLSDEQLQTLEAEDFNANELTVEA